MDGHVKLMLVRCVRFASPRFTPLIAARAPVPSSVWKFDIRSRPARRACPTRWTLTRILSFPGAQPEVESSDDEEDAWAKWEAKNHEQRERRRLMGELRGARALASETSRAVRDARTRSRSPEGGRRGPRAKRDPIYAELLDRRDQNAERLREARERQYFHDAEEFLGTKSPQSRPSPGSGRSPGRPRSSPGVRALPAPGDPSRDSSSDDDDDEGDDARRGRETAGGASVRAALSRQLAATRRSLSRPSSAASHRAPRRPPSRAASEGAFSPGRGRPASRYGEYDYDGDKVAFGCHFTYEAEAARARRGVVPPRHSAKTTTTFDPPRLFTSSRPMERVRNRRAMERAWRRQELTESVVMRTVGTLAGEPGLRKHWDDPLRAAAEQAAAKVASEEGIAATSETARAAARRAAAAAARLVDAELLSSDGDSPEGRSLRSRAKRAYLGDVAAALRDPVGFAALPPDRFHVDAREDRPRGFESDDGASGDEGESLDDGEGLDDDEYGDFARELAVVDAADARAPSRPGSRFEASRFEASRPASVLTSPSRRRRPRVTSASASSVRRESRRSSSSSAPPPPSDDPYSNRPIARGRFLRSGHGGAGMARGRSVAAMEEFSNPEHAARLRRSLEASAGPALAAARAEQARAAARVGHARARARREAEAAAKAEAAARAARRSVRRKPPVFAAPAPRFDAPGSARESLDDASLVIEARRRLDAKLHRDENRHVSYSRRPSAPPRRSKPPPRPDFDLDVSTPSDGRAFLGAPASPVYTPIARAHGANDAAARFAEAHRRAVMEPSPVSVRFRPGDATTSPGSTREVDAWNPRAKRQTPEGKHGLQLVRETLASELDWARG